MVCDGRRVFRDCDEERLARLYGRRIRRQRHGAALLLVPGRPRRRRSRPARVKILLRAGAASAVRGVVAAAINAKVDFGRRHAVSCRRRRGPRRAATTRRCRRARPVQPPVVLHPATREPTWFCNVHSHSPSCARSRSDQTPRFEDGASRINKSDMRYGDDGSIAEGDLDHL